MDKLILVVIILFSLKSYSQTNHEAELLEYSSSRTLGRTQILSNKDCATPFTIKASGKYYFNNLPKGFGQDLEFSKNSLSSLHYIEKEHNSLWIRFRITKTGTFAFKILPDNIDVDLDFMLFEKKNDNFCSQIINKKNIPIRSNMSRPDKSNYSSTGLSVLAEKDFYSSGQGKAYCNSINVTKGDEYILVIDQANEVKKNGFHLQFQYFDYTVISGSVSAENSTQPVESVVLWEDASTGEVLGKVKTNPKTGGYEMKVPYEPYNLKAPYMLTTEKEGYFYPEKSVNTKELKSSSKQLSLVLPKLKKSALSRIRSINFVGGQARVLPSSISSLKRLYKLMLKNPTLKIRIDGHINGYNEDQSMAYLLSIDRAKTVLHYLSSNGINKNRITIKGFGESKMLFPSLSRTEEEAEMNRRVEVLVLEY